MGARQSGKLSEAMAAEREAIELGHHVHRATPSGTWCVTGECGWGREALLPRPVAGLALGAAGREALG